MNDSSRRRRPPSLLLTCSKLSSWHCFWSRSLRHFSACCSSWPMCCCALADSSSFQSDDVHLGSCRVISEVSLSWQSCWTIAPCPVLFTGCWNFDCLLGMVWSTQWWMATEDPALCQHKDRSGHTKLGNKFCNLETRNLRKQWDWEWYLIAQEAVETENILLLQNCAGSSIISIFTLELENCARLKWPMGQCCGSKCWNLGFRSYS